MAVERARDGGDDEMKHEACPFCGCDDLSPEIVGRAGTMEVSAIRCGTCKALGPQSKPGYDRSENDCAAWWAWDDRGVTTE